MELLKTNTGEFLKDLDGNLLVTAGIPPIMLEHEDIQFPPNLNLSGSLRITTTGTNTVYIDFDDGSPIYSRTFSGLTIFPVNDPIHIYADNSRKFVKIWFEFPQRITQFSAQWLYLIGNFPTAIGLYDLDDLTFRQTRFDYFPAEFRGGIYRTLALADVTRSTINHIPMWITQSRVQNLILGGMDLSNPTTSNLDKLINIQGLTNLDLYTTGFDNIPFNFKDIATLRLLGLGNNPFTEITQEINDCKQLTRLSIGYRAGGWSSQGSPLFTSWGVGIANMPNLQRFEWDSMPNAPTTLPTGILTAPNCKSLWCIGAYRTQVRIDEFVENSFDLVESEASMSVGNTLLRRVNFQIGAINFANSAFFNPRPTGTYQAPAGYVQGSNNGTPASPMEMIYVLVNQYEWTVTVINEAGNANQTYAP